MLTQERLKELLSYDPETGAFTWLLSPGPKRKGEQAGSQHHSGYRFVKLDGKMYAEHRIAFLYVHGYFPEGDVDHINRIRNDNRPDNLRESTRQCNIRNACTSKNNSSGTKGIFFSKAEQRWIARIGADYRNAYLGIFDDRLEAACHRYAAEQCLGFPECDINSTAKQIVDRHLIQHDNALPFWGPM